MAIIMDGKKISAKICEQVATEAALLPRKPSLAAILVGVDPASQLYIRNKEKDCEKCGFESLRYDLPETTSEVELLALIDELNKNNCIDGILIQLPLPEHINENAVIEAISPLKDVDAINPANIGRMVTGEPAFWPCTPSGVMELFHEYEIELNGKLCVMIGRSNIVGKPMSMLMLGENATVIICHSHTPNLRELTLQADIIVSAVGKIGLVTADMIKEGAVVIDVAINKNPETGKFVGDVCFDEVSEKAACITPVPGGVGPVTRAVLMKHILTASKKSQENA